MAKLFGAAVLLFVGAAVWLSTSNLFPRADTTPPINVMNYGATGNGTTDDTPAMITVDVLIGRGDVVRFVSHGNVRVSQLTINTSNVTVDGGSCAIIRNTASGTIMVIGAVL